MAQFILMFQKFFLTEIFNLFEPRNTSPFLTFCKAPQSSRQLLKRMNERKCIFVHIPKCAGISISHNVFGCYPIGHRSIQGYRNIFSSETFNEYFKFSIVRNPWDRLVSVFLFLKKGGWQGWDKKWAEINLSPYEDFDSFVHGWLNKENIMTWFHFIPQYQYIYLKNGKMPLDFIGNYENLNADFSYICDHLKIKPELLKRNTSKRKHDDYRKYYTKETQRVVAEVYADDIRILGYSFDSSSPKICNMV